MVQREQVADERGRLWVSGALPSEEWFRTARREAREQARRDVTARLALRSTRATAAARLAG